MNPRSEKLQKPQSSIPDSTSLSWHVEFSGSLQHSKYGLFRRVPRRKPRFSKHGSTAQACRHDSCRLPITVFGGVMVWACFASPGPEHLPVTESNMNSSVYQSIRYMSVEPYFSYSCFHSLLNQRVHVLESRENLTWQYIVFLLNMVNVSNNVVSMKGMLRLGHVGSQVLAVLSFLTLDLIESRHLFISSPRRSNHLNVLGYQMKRKLH